MGKGTVEESEMQKGKLGADATFTVKGLRLDGQNLHSSPKRMSVHRITSPSNDPYIYEFQHYLSCSWISKMLRIEFVFFIITSKQEAKLD